MAEGMNCQERHFPITYIGRIWFVLVMLRSTKVAHFSYIEHAPVSYSYSTAIPKILLQVLPQSKARYYTKVHASS